MKIIYDSNGNKLKKPLNLTLKQLLKKDVGFVLNNLPVISYKELKRPTYTKYLKSKINMGEFNPNIFAIARVLFGWDEQTYREFLQWYEKGE